MPMSRAEWEARQVRNKWLLDNAWPEAWDKGWDALAERVGWYGALYDFVQGLRAAVLPEEEVA